MRVYAAQAEEHPLQGQGYPGTTGLVEMRFRRRLWWRRLPRWRPRGPRRRKHGRDTVTAGTRRKTARASRISTVQLVVVIVVVCGRHCRTGLSDCSIPRNDIRFSGPQRPVHQGSCCNPQTPAAPRLRDLVFPCWALSECFVAATRTRAQRLSPWCGARMGPQAVSERIQRTFSTFHKLK